MVAGMAQDQSEGRGWCLKVNAPTGRLRRAQWGGLAGRDSAPIANSASASGAPIDSKWVTDLKKLSVGRPRCGQRHGAIVRPMKPRSGSASLAPTSWFTWSAWVKWWLAWGEVSRIAWTGPPRSAKASPIGT